MHSFCTFGNRQPNFPPKYQIKCYKNKLSTALDFDRTIQEATSGAFPSSLSSPDIDKENGLPISLGTYRPVSIGIPNLPQQMENLVDGGRLGYGIRSSIFSHFARLYLDIIYYLSETVGVSDILERNYPATHHM